MFLTGDFVMPTRTVTDKERVTKYESYLNTLNVQGLNFPLSPKQIPLFEKLNPDDQNDCTLKFKSIQKQHRIPF